MSALNGKIVATIANQVKIFELNKNNDLQSDAPYSGNIVALYSDVSENGFILVGDLMRSISGKTENYYLLLYRIKWFTDDSKKIKPTFPGFQLFWMITVPFILIEVFNYNL